MAKAGATFKEKDRGWQKFKDEMAKVRGRSRVKVGVLASSGVHEGTTLTVADVATFHEFGGPNNNPPERSFLRATVDIKRVEIAGKTEELVNKIMTCAAYVKPSLALLGVMLQGWIRERITAGIAPPLSEATIRIKNAGIIEKAKGTISRIQSKANPSAKDVTRHVAAANIVQSGGKSTALIDTGQLRNSIQFEVEIK